MINSQYSLSRTKTKLSKNAMESISNFNNINELNIIPNLMTKSLDTMFIYDLYDNTSSTFSIIKMDPMA
jgi:hypothetical protein